MCVSGSSIQRLSVKPTILFFFYISLIRKAKEPAGIATEPATCLFGPTGGAGCPKCSAPRFFAFPPASRPGGATSSTWRDLPICSALEALFSLNEQHGFGEEAKATIHFSREN